MKKFYLLSAVCAMFALNTQAQSPGSLDITFNNDGIYTMDFGKGDNMNDVKIQSNQQIVCTGIAFNAFFSPELRVFRLNQNGTLDNNFGVNGVFSFSYGSESYGYESQILDNGKILVAGMAMDPFYYADILLIRLNANGTIDSTFGNNGFTVTSYTVRDDYAYGMVVQPDGKILVAGSMTDTISYFRNPSIVRFNSNGFVDSTFGVNGMLIVPAIGGDNEFNSITLQPNGKIIAAGHYSYVNTGLVDFDFCVARADANGVLDPTFGTAGLAVTKVGFGLNSAQGVALDTALNIVVAGFSNNLTTDMALLKYDPTGTLDPNFGAAGIVQFDVADIDGAYDVKVEADNKIVVCGTSGQGMGGSAGITVWKYDANGSPDSSFANIGYVITHIALNNEEGNSLALQADGKIVVAGKFFNANGGNNDAAVLRYNNSIVNTSVNEITSATTLAIYPNPAKENQTLAITTDHIFDNKAQVKIMDMLGNLVYITNCNFQNGLFNLQLPTSIVSGVYFVTISDSKSRLVQKITVN